jgi:hypothetical protein
MLELMGQAFLQRASLCSGAALKPFLRDALVSGAIASLASTAVLAMMGRRELDDAATPLNGPSQWVWGRHAPYRDGLSLHYTATGYAVHHAASTFWGFLYEAMRRMLRGRGAAGDIAAAAATTVIAGVVDFRLTPQRLRPGFEKRLSAGAVAMAYVAFAAGLAAHAWLRRK